MVESAVIERHLSISEAAELSRVCYATVWRAVKADREQPGTGLSSTRRHPKGRILIAESDLRAWAFPDEAP